MSTATMSRTVRRGWWWLLWSLMALLAIAIAAYFVPPYMVGGERVPIEREIVGYYTSLAIHALPAGLVLVIGPFQFVPRLRARFPKVHRVAGRIYLISIIPASAAAAYASAVTKSGFPLQVAFYILIAAWLFTAAMAFRAIRRGEVQLHRIWMIRNYALTFASVTLRVYYAVFVIVFPTLGENPTYTAAAWAGLLVNVMVAEYFIVQRILSPLVRRKRRVRETPEAATTAVAAG